YHHVVRGYNRRLDSLQAAMLRIKLPYLDEWNRDRRLRADLYGRLLYPVVRTPATAGFADAVWHLYVIQVSDRDRLQARLAEQGISTGVHYPVPIHLQPAYRDLGYKRGDFPVAEQAAERILSLPMYPELPLSSIEYVCSAVQAFEADGDRVATAS